MIMQRRTTINRWLITAWFLIIGCTLSVSYGQQYGAPYRGASTYRSSTISNRNSASPAYEFQSTSSFTSVVGNSIYAAPVTSPYATRAAGANPRKSFGDPEDEEVWSNPEGEGYGLGEIPNPAPIGEPLILLVLAILYTLLRYYKQKLAKK